MAVGQARRACLLVAVLLGSAATAISGCATSGNQCVTVPVDREPALHPTPCPAGAPSNATCGTLSVPEAGVAANRNAGEGSANTATSCLLDIAWIILTPESVTNEVPLFILGGGPGDPLLARIDEVAALTDAAAPGKVVVAHDPRGVGSSAPTLDCRDIPVEEGMDRDAWLASCANTYRTRGHDDRAYRTAVLVEDVVELASELGFDTFDVLGISYGSRLAQELVRTHPERVRALVLDAATPTDTPLLEVGAGHLRDALARVSSDCDDSAVCGSRFPDLASQVDDTLVRLTNDPAPLALGESTFPLSPELYASTLSILLSRGALLPAVPAYIAEVHAQNYDAVTFLLSNIPVPETAFFMHHAVMCAEELPRNERARAIADRTSFPAYSEELLYDTLTATCEAMMLPTDGSPPTQTPVTVPTLALTGRYDPLSPTSNWPEFSDRFSNGTLVDIPTGHGTLRDPCGQQAIGAFLDNPGTFALPACTRTQATPDFSDTSFEILGPALAR
ncbi:MAG: alpha/beta fold hydrolase [Myxococcota bacterium]